MIRERFKAGDKKTMLFLATGGGKSLVFKDIITSLVKNRFKVLFLVRRRELIFQAAQKHFNHLDCSIVMGSEKGFDPTSPLQVCSIDTLNRRLHQVDYEFLKDFHYVVVDEGHDTTSKKYRETLDTINFKALIALTATPFRVGNKVHDYFDSCVKPIEMHELRDQGFLCDARVYAPKKIDVSGIKKVAGDFHQGQLFEKVSESEIVGDIVKTYNEYGKGKPAILFCVNIAHSELMAAAFNAAGVKAIHIDQSHNKEERAFALKQLREGKIQILSNVNVMSTGIDEPSIGVLILARPTMSEVLYVQQVGRGLRPYKICQCGTEYGGEKECYKCGSRLTKFEKEYLIVLDHANNTSRHGLPYKVRKAELTEKDKKNKKEDDEIIISTCPNCFAVLENRKLHCPFCDSSIVSQRNQEVKQTDGELKLIDETEEINKKWVKLKMRENQYHKPPKEKYFLLHKSFGDKVFNVIEYPKHIKAELQRNGFLFSASKLIEKSSYSNPKRVFKY